MTYIDDLQVAHQRTARLGFRPPPIKIRSERLLRDDKLAMVVNRYPPVTPLQFAGQCNMATAFYLDIVRDIFACEAYFTVGWVNDGGRELFKMTDASIELALESSLGGAVRRDYNHHAWITLDSLEVIDLTLPTSLAHANTAMPKAARAKMTGAVIFGHADELNGGLRYCPMVLSEEFYYGVEGPLYPMIRKNYFENMRDPAPAAPFWY